MNARLAEYPDRHFWDLSGYTLDQIALDYRLTLYIAGRGGSVGAVTVVIETPFVLCVGEKECQIVPKLTVTTIPVLPLLHKPVASLTAHRTGQLVIAFLGGETICADRHEQYESWHIYGSGETEGATMECTPHLGSPF